MIRKLFAWLRADDVDPTYGAHLPIALERTILFYGAIAFVIIITISILT